MQEGLEEFDRLVAEANAGEQNRYGDIEFVHPFADRLALLKQAVHLGHTLPLTPCQDSQLSDALYWNMGVDFRPFTFLFDHYQVAGVATALEAPLSARMSDDSRLRWLGWHLENIQQHGRVPQAFLKRLRAVSQELETKYPKDLENLKSQLQLVEQSPTVQKT